MPDSSYVQRKAQKPSGPRHHRLFTPEFVKNFREVPSSNTLIEAAMVLLAAGTDTTSNAMAVGPVFHNPHDEAARHKLQVELQAAWSESDAPFLLRMAERLPYLRGVIKEARRLNIGVTTALPRIGLLSMGLLFLLVPSHINPDIFPDPLASMDGSGFAGVGQVSHRVF
ncbi:hypothetical protein BDZ89DRAFT_1171134 [Hymenopellis radicata]|nr:hypothetical protein BDZ89DRAFT_1171134 [Hymenopellis radicata]